VLRAELREQLRVSAQQWHDRGRPAALLWRDDLLAELEQWMQRSVRTGPLTKLELEFVDASKDRAAVEAEARRRRRTRLYLATVALVFAGAAAGLGALQWRAVERARDAQNVSEAKQTATKVEQGRAALLHGEIDEARQHLGEAWQRGERSFGMAFMLARALQPRLAELATFSSISGRMWSAAFSPDGQQIVTTDDGGAQVWDVHSHQLLLSLPGDRVYSAVYGARSGALVSQGNYLHDRPSSEV
jgi:hypothetical protein